MRVALPLVATVIALGALPGSPTAGTLDEAKLSLYVRVPVSKGCFGGPFLGSNPCSTFPLWNPTGQTYFVYLVAARGSADGFKGLSCGIEYDPAGQSGVEVNSWSQCSDGLEILYAGANGQWPASGAGIRTTWSTCQLNAIAPDDVHAVAGFFYIFAYSDDVMRITPNYVAEPTPELEVVDCALATTVLDSTVSLASAEFGGEGSLAYDPCCSPCVDIVPPTGTVSAGDDIVAPIQVHNCSVEDTVDVALVIEIASSIAVEETLWAMSPLETRAVLLPIPCSGSGPVSVQYSATYWPIQDPFCTASSDDLSFVQCDATLGAGVGDAGNGLRLHPASPSPFRGRTAIAFDLAREARVTLTVYDVSGRRVRVLDEGWYGAGRHSVEWRGDDGGGSQVPPGLYFLSLDAGTARLNRKVVKL